MGTLRQVLDRKLQLVFAGLAVMAIAVAGITLHTGHFISARLAISQAEQQAMIWRYNGLNILTMGSYSFVKGRVTPEDQREIFNILQTTDTYRMTMLDASGRAFWSSNPKFINTTDNSVELKRTAKTLMLQTRREQVAASNVDRLLLDRTYEPIKPNDMRETTVVYVPVVKRRKLAGALVLHSDATDLVATYNMWSERAAILVAAVLCGFIGFIGWLIFSYARQRRDSELALTCARDEAVEAHREVEEVHQKVMALNRDLHRHMQQLAEAQNEIIRKGKMAQLGQLTATIAHDIRNPLGTVRTAAFLISRKFKDAAPGIEKPIERINSGIARCDGIISELLDFARTNDLSTETLDLDEWLRQQVEEQASRLPAVVDVTFNPGADGTEAEFDPGSMQRVLVNVLSNASEAMVGRGDDPEIYTTANPKIEVSSVVTARGVEIRVADNGPGMSEELKSKVLEPLFTTKNFGVGLGLPAVEKVLQQHGGGLEIESIEGEGTTMIAWFPVTKTESSTSLHGDGRHLKGSFLAVG